MVCLLFLLKGHFWKYRRGEIHQETSIWQPTSRSWILLASQRNRKPQVFVNNSHSSKSAYNIRLVQSFPKLPKHIKAGYMHLSVRVYIPNLLRCFQCQCSGHSKSSNRGTLICARCAEVAHDSTTCTTKEKCANCKGDHTSFSRNCFAWEQEKEIISTKIKNQISYAEARKLVKSKSSEACNCFASVVKKISATVYTQWDLADIPSGTNLKPSASATITSSPVNAQNLSPVTVSICESTPVTSDLNGFQLVTNRKKIKKDSPTKTNSISNAEKISTFYTTSYREVHTSFVTQSDSNMHQAMNEKGISDETKLTHSIAFLIRREKSFTISGI
ncbi:hypothetical protein AVEN_2617-1 [Araneus ventricosus]|uniref:Nucleic-acid-binding protein from mobile element jockey n=1 Tax=Araneus ventricosus TaxID=182803 RepID=A0A4Y2E9Z1_ARAVE|nr:hypothetical protein AVEN_2617-1 [Araneus ventricosus]